MVSGPLPSPEVTLSTPTCTPARNSSRSARLMLGGMSSPVRDVDVPQDSVLPRLADEERDAIDDALEAEPEGAGRVMGGTVFGAGGRADPDRRGIAGRVEDVGQQRAVSLPPLLIGDAGASLGFGGFDGSPGGAADVVVEKAGDEVH